jgi:structure-specific recognition protein 1
LLFIHKPTLLINYDEIATVTCERLSESTQRFFEMTIKTKRGDTFEFNNFERKEYDSINKYLQDKKIKVISDDGEDGEEIITSKKIRKAPENYNEDLPSEKSEDDYKSDDEEDDDYSESDSEKSKDKKKSNKGKKK